MKLHSSGKRVEILYNIFWEQSSQALLTLNRKYHPLEMSFINEIHNITLNSKIFKAMHPVTAINCGSHNEGKIIDKRAIIADAIPIS